MEDLILIITQLFTILTSIFGVYFAVISLCCLIRRHDTPTSDEHLRFAVLIPARNEAQCIAGIIDSLHRQDYPRELVDIFVIPNNCRDNTAAVAAAAGARILPVSSAVQSKGQALHEAFSYLLLTESHQAFCVFDADNELNPTFLSEMNRALAVSRVAKSRIFAKNPHESWICACYDSFFCNANLLLNRARMQIGLSAHLIGTGFAVRRDLMMEMNGWNTDTLTEDAEFYAQLCARGEKIQFVPEAIVYDEEPLTFRESLTQRRRWMSGIIEVNRIMDKDLLHGITTGVGGWCAVDCLIQLSFVYLQAWILPMFLLRLCADPASTLVRLPLTVLTYCLSTIFLGALSLLLEHRMTWRKAASLLLYPLFLFSFLPLQTLGLLLPNRNWKPIQHTGVRLKP